jgi:hypothetical protein
MTCAYFVAIDPHDYPHSEGRFYCSDFSDGGDPEPATAAALEASRAARFGVVDAWRPGGA